MLNDKVCVVTGSGEGIGRATALEMASQGARVVVSDVNWTTGEETAAQIKDAGGDAKFIPCDVRKKADIESLMVEAVETYGGIDVLHNNAGIMDGDLEPRNLTVDTLPDEVWEAVYEVNLRGVWLCTKLAAPYLRESTKGPAIVNAGSVASLTGYAMNPTYNAAKGGVLQLTKVTAIDLAPKIRCNCYCPGSVDTRMVRQFIDGVEDKEMTQNAFLSSHLIPRFGEPEDVAKLVCFLASDDASWITGAAYVIDGGALAWRGERPVE